MKITSDKTANRAKPVRGETKSANKLFRNARRVQQNYYYSAYGYGGGQEDMKEAWYLAEYSLKMVSCLQGEQSINYEGGEIEPSTIIFRLCPKDTCSANTTMGCDSGFGDFAVGINTFTEAYTESVKDSYNSGMQFYNYQYGEFNVEEYTKECRLFEEGEGQGQRNGYYGGYNGGYNGGYDGDYDNDGNNGGYNGANNGYFGYSYVGVACTSDGKGIRLASFSDPYCTQESSTSFSETHYGIELPYTDGGLVPDACVDCMQMNDNYEYEISEICKKTYEDASYRCEENMESFNTYYGKNNQGCDYMGSKLPSGSTTDTSTSNEGNASNSPSNFFTEQSRSAKLAAEYIAVFVVAGLVGAGIVIFLSKKAVRSVQARKQSGKSLASDDGVFNDGEGESSPGFWQSMKEKVHDATTKIKTMTGDEINEYNQMHDDATQTTSNVDLRTFSSAEA